MMSTLLGWDQAWSCLEVMFSQKCRAEIARREAVEYNCALCEKGGCGLPKPVTEGEKGTSNFIGRV